MVTLVTIVISWRLFFREETIEEKIEKARAFHGGFILDYFQLDCPNKYNGILWEMSDPSLPTYYLSSEENKQVFDILKKTIRETDKVQLTFYLDDEGIERRDYDLDNPQIFLHSLISALETPPEFNFYRAGCQPDRWYYMDFTLFPSMVKLHYTLDDGGAWEPPKQNGWSLALSMGEYNYQKLYFKDAVPFYESCFSYPISNGLTARQLKAQAWDNYKMNKKH